MPDPPGACSLAVAAPEATVVGGDITIACFDAQPHSAQDVGFTGCSVGGCGPFLLDDDADATHPRQLSGTGLAPGTYQVTQQAVPGWTLTAVECDTGETVDLGARRVAIDLSDGEHATCTFTVAAAAITVVLDAQPDSGADVGFTGCGALGCGPFTLDDDADPAHQARLTAAGLADCTYTITQAALPGRVPRLHLHTGGVGRLRPTAGHHHPGGLPAGDVHLRDRACAGPRRDHRRE